MGGFCHIRPIRTISASISSGVRRLTASSRTLAIIGRFISNRYTELFGVVFVAVAVLVFWGSTGEGQASLLDGWLRGYVEEKATALDGSRRTGVAQIADASIIMGGSGSDAAIASPLPTADASTVHQNALLAVTSTDGNYLDHIIEKRNQISEYTVQQGDLLSFIASDYGVSVDSVIWANGLKDADSISPGQILKIPPVSGVIHRGKQGDTATSLAKLYGADSERIIAYNRLPKDGTVEVGDDIIVPDGKIADQRVPFSTATHATPRAPLYGTASIARLISAAKQFAHLPDLGDFFKMPTLGFNWGLIHGRNGVDVANSCGTPIYAAADGVVTVADAVGWNGGFGKYIKISHPNDTETLYAHASKLLVGNGQAVGKGDKIALMGTTGRSTGCHLHFEVHGAQNPLAKD